MNPVERQLAASLFDIGAIKFGSFRLKLHENNPEAPLSPVYLNLRTPDNPKPGPLTPEMVEMASQCMYWITRSSALLYMLTAGVPHAGDPFAARLAHHSDVALLKLKKTKDGDRRAITDIKAGALTPGGLTVLVDDLITKAESKLEAIKVLEKHGLCVKDIVVLVDREQGGKEKLTRWGYKLHSVFTLRQLLEHYVEDGKIDIATRDKVLGYLQKDA
jgi:orotate phosphoribosyltransferase